LVDTAMFEILKNTL